jgi:hypothetical protein
VRWKRRIAQCGGSFEKRPMNMLPAPAELA